MFKDKHKASLLAVFALVTSATYLELTGYNDFDQADGRNVICDIDPTCRYMTENERKVTEPYFGETPYHKTTKIFNRSNLAVEIQKKLHCIESPAVTYKGNIYYSDAQFYANDFSQHHDKQLIFIHEFTHVAQEHGLIKQRPSITTSDNNQNQNKSHNHNKTFSCANKNADPSKYGNAVVYEYSLHNPKTFEEYGIEPQAKIVEHYAQNRLLYETAPSPERKKSLCVQIKEFEKKLIPALPITSFKPCQTYNNNV